MKKSKPIYLTNLKSIDKSLVSLFQTDNMKAIISFLENCKEEIHKGELIKINLGNHKGNQIDLKQIIIKPVIIKHTLKMAFNYKYKTKDIFKNYEIDQGIEKIGAYIKDGFHSATMITTTQHLILNINSKQIPNLKKVAVKEKDYSKLPVVNLNHDRIKHKDINANSGYLNALGLTDEKGEVFKNAQDKFKQINHFIKLLKPEIRDLGPNQINKVADMGSGKGYLTFALYNYLQQQNPDIKMKGVEYRKDLVDFCNKISKENHFKGLDFIQGNIRDTNIEDLDLLIALHACDTATDEAISIGIKNKSKLIVVAPCCHKQIRREIEQNKPTNELNIITKHGVFLEKHAEMLTDAIRILILEYYGYKVKALEFISDSHTPKNVMLLATYKGKINAEQQNKILIQLNKAKKFYGFSFHQLEKLMDIKN